MTRQKWTPRKFILDEASPMAIILKIAERGESLARKHGVRNVRRIDVVMALTMVNDKTPLRLAALFSADDGNFAHDVFGILRHIDPMSGDLRGGFSPRFTDYAQAKP